MFGSGGCSRMLLLFPPFWVCNNSQNKGVTDMCSCFYCTSSGLHLSFKADGQLLLSFDLRHFMPDEYEQASRRETGSQSSYCRMPRMWRDPLEEAEGWREAEAHWSRCREMWEGVRETGDDALVAAESWRGRGPGSDSPHPHGASWLTSLSTRCGISLLQLLREQQPHLSLACFRKTVHLSSGHLFSMTDTSLFPFPSLFFYRFVPIRWGMWDYLK